MAGICNLCGLPEELCICQEIAKEQQTAVISTARRRYGKMVTIVDGIEDTAIDINQLAKTLKSACASGEPSRDAQSNYKGSTRKEPQKYSNKTDTGWRCDDEPTQSTMAC